jgi:NADPH-ferrihemoprotein reductase
MLDNIPIDSLGKLDTVSLLLLVIGAILSILWIQPLRKSWKFGKSGEGSSCAKLQANSNERDVLAKMKMTGKNCAVFFGSQTGMAEDLAARLAKEGHSRFGLKTLLCNLEDYDLDTLDGFTPDMVAMFVMATFGEGEPTDNAQDFWDFLTAEDVSFSKNEDCDTPLSNLNYVCFGLGNSSYAHYNSVSKTTDATLRKLGARRVGALGLGDDGEKSVDEDFMAWKEPMWLELSKTLSLTEKESVYEPSFTVIPRPDLTQESSQVFLGEPNRMRLQGIMRGPYNSKNPLAAKIVESRELFQDGPRHCVHMEIDISESGWTYTTGDHILICPVNAEMEVDRFLQVFGLISKRHEVIELKALDNATHLPFPTPTTYEAAIRYHMEICGPTSRQFLQDLGQFAPSQGAKQELSRLANDKDYFHQQVTVNHANLAQTLEAITAGQIWSAVPFSMLVEGLLTLQPRPYSISSSSLVQKDRISITAVVESFQIQDSARMFNGVSSNYLLALHQKQNPSATPRSSLVTYATDGPRKMYRDIRLPVYIRESNFRLPRDPSTPIIMIGPGTGVAPFRAFMQERAAQREAGENVGRSLLFYGCRRKTEDFLYQEDWNVSLFQ